MNDLSKTRDVYKVYLIFLVFLVNQLDTSLELDGHKLVGQELKNLPNYKFLEKVHSQVGAQARN